MANERRAGAFSCLFPLPRTSGPRALVLDAFNRCGDSLTRLCPCGHTWDAANPGFCACSPPSRPGFRGFAWSMPATPFWFSCLFSPFGFPLVYRLSMPLCRLVSLASCMAG